MESINSSESFERQQYLETYIKGGIDLVTVTSGAGRGNRTPAERLEIFRSTIKLYLHFYQ